MGLLVGTMYEIVPSVQQKKKKGGLVSTRRRNTYFLNSVVRLGSVFSTLLLDWGVKDPVPAPWAGKTPTLLVPSPTRPMSHWPQTKGKTNIQTTSNRRGGNFNAALITNPANVSPGRVT